MNFITEDKTAGILDVLVDIEVSASSERYFTVHWDTTESYTSQTVHVAYRLKNNTDSFSFIDSVSRDTGSASSPSGLESAEYTIWLRTETADHYGVWQYTEVHLVV